MSSQAPVSVSDIEQHLAELRRSYVEALPRQRLHIGKLRIQNPEHDPNRLIAFVSAVEGFARSICMHLRAKTKPELSQLYAEYWKKGAEDLISEYLSARSLGEPATHFGQETWRLFGYAVQYRNLLAHECTYLGLDRSPALIEACREVLRKLANDAGLSADDI
jgi:hypothetical protein